MVMVDAGEVRARWWLGKDAAAFISSGQTLKNRNSSKGRVLDANL